MCYQDWELESCYTYNCNGIVKKTPTDTWMKTDLDSFFTCAGNCSETEIKEGNKRYVERGGYCTDCFRRAARQSMTSVQGQEHAAQEDDKREAQEPQLDRKRRERKEQSEERKQLKAVAEQRRRERQHRRERETDNTRLGREWKNLNQKQWRKEKRDQGKDNMQRERERAS